jgi:hypothetical protein
MAAAERLARNRREAWANRRTFRFAMTGGRFGALVAHFSVFRNSALDYILIFGNNACIRTSCFRRPERGSGMQYFVVMIDYGRRGREAIVDPEITRREVVARVASGEYKNISFIHEIADSTVDDVTAEILAEAALPEIPITGADLQAGQFDHVRDLRKHEAD